MSSTKDCPPIPADLLAHLDKTFPERTPELDWTLDRIRHEGGQRAVVRHLRRVFEDQNRNILQPKNT